MVSAGDHERMPEKEGSQEDNEYKPTKAEKDFKIKNKHLKGLRRGVNLKYKSPVVDNLVGQSMEEYEASLAERSGKKVSKNKSVSPNPRPNSPVKGRISKSTKTLPSKPVNKPESKPKDMMINKPIDLHGNNDMATLFKLASENKNGFKMTNKLKKRLMRRK